MVYVVNVLLALIECAAVNSALLRYRWIYCAVGFECLCAINPVPVLRSKVESGQGVIPSLILSLIFTAIPPIKITPISLLTASQMPVSRK